jgi:hypothetical protein
VSYEAKPRAASVAVREAGCYLLQGMRDGLRTLGLAVLLGVLSACGDEDNGSGRTEPIDCAGKRPKCESACGASDVVDAVCKGKPGATSWDCPPDRPLVVGIDCPACDACDPGTYCSDWTKQCNFDVKANASCVPMPKECSGKDLACGCNGKVYQSPCHAAAEGIDLDWYGCDPPSPDVFTCGYGFCKRYEEYCMTYADDSFPKCAPKPAGCSVLDCSCATCSGGSPYTCTGTDGAISVSCPTF